MNRVFRHKAGWMGERLSLLLAMVGAIFLGVFWVDPFSRSAGTADALRVNVSELDFGVVQVGSHATQTLMIENAGDQSLDFLFGYECSCTSCEPKSGSLQAGESLPVTVSYFPKPGNGSYSPQNTQLTIQSRADGAETSQRVTVSAIGYQPLLVNPEQLQLQTEALAAPKSFSVDLSLQSDVETVEILSVPDFLEQVQLGELNASFKTIPLTGSIKSPEGTNELRGELQFRVLHPSRGAPSDGRRQDDVFSLTISVHVQKPFEVEPATLFLASGQACKVVVEPHSHIDELRILDVEFPAGIAKVEGNTLIMTSDLNGQSEAKAHTSGSVEDNGPLIESSADYLTFTVHCSNASGQQQFPVFVPIVYQAGLEAPEN